MLTRLILAGATVVALGAPAAFAGGPSPFFCSFAFSTQCAVQVTEGSHNKARTDQTTDHRFGHQTAFTFQKGDSNRSYIGQDGKDEFATAMQIGNGNGAYTYQEGAHQTSTITQVSNGAWGGVSSIGDGAVTKISQTN